MHFQWNESPHHPSQCGTPPPLPPELGFLRVFRVLWSPRVFRVVCVFRVFHDRSIPKPRVLRVFWALRLRVFWVLWVFWVLGASHVLRVFRKSDFDRRRELRSNFYCKWCFALNKLFDSFVHIVLPHATYHLPSTTYHSANSWHYSSPGPRAGTAPLGHELWTMNQEPLIID